MDPEDALQALPCLHLDPRFQLAAFQYLADGGTHGYGAVWAVSADVPRAALAENCRLTGDASEPPPGALDDAMGAIDGDRSPWSYLCASMLSRELGDLGAVWHGADWMHHRVLSGPPWERRAKEWWVEVLGTLRQEDFRWLEPPPACWEPRVEVESDEVRVVFHTWYVAHGSRIERHIDRYRPGGYVAEREATVVAEGLGDCFI